ncbi:ORF0.67 [Yersinia enterocolitica subsp. palearctica Y11]|uniref:ORF0.67 n=1 Tax=Yersinia enterocolitica subsp. palearctica serotype O:3 (strain DSM 13030 / CIP 106945 / Y11) TaxID=930944 RepID=A0A0H3NN25_YERE1|nr:ORF0.67 [Yersinia enterocolitica subsp. palearctica Y11]CCO69286.1 Orf0.67 [Yersinia enterocolitica IP 10393]
MVLLWGGVFKHGGQSVFCTDLIRSKSEIYDICHKEYRCKKERKIVTI